jgi:hypothetical protein
MTACDDPEGHYQFGVDMFMAGVTTLAAAKTATAGKTAKAASQPSS